jgi:hypothetical protein
MTVAPLEDLRAAHASISAWLERARSSPDPSSQAGANLKTIAAELLRAESALRAAPRESQATEEWKNEVAAYRDDLLGLKNQIEHIEIVLRMRAAKIKKRRAKTDALRSWADLTHNIHSGRKF